MKIEHLDEGVGRIVKGVNTTPDVGVNQTSIEAGKFGNKVDKDGRPPTLSTKVKGKSTNVHFNLGMVKEDTEPRYTAREWAIMEGGHSLDDVVQPKQPGDIFTALEEKWSQKYKRSINCNNPKGFSQKAHCAGRKKNEDIEENFADGRKFVEPNFSSEWEEAERYPEFVKIGKEAWIELARNGEAVTITDASDINNTDAAEPDSFKSLDPAKQKRALAQLEKGEVEMPIVAVYSDGWKELIGGNTRLTAMMARDGQATVWEFIVPDEVAELAENFADGKRKGKSRPGRVKKAGASCNGSVTDLRKRAKKYGGERGRMYHWCANMKSGRKKS